MLDKVFTVIKALRIASTVPTGLCIADPQPGDISIACLIND
jgi:hypothetical protein